jgi:hypothetical protein
LLNGNCSRFYGNLGKPEEPHRARCGEWQDRFARTVVCQTT